MRASRLGCFSLSAILTGLLTLAVIAGFLWTQGNSMFSPGALNAQTGEIMGGVSSHADIGGECGLCHTAPWDSATMAARCADCHASIRTELADPAKLHGAISARNPAGTCMDCHSEHQGRASQLTRVEGVAFPHDVLGFILTGHKLTASSQPFACADCHNEELSTFKQATCVDCHRGLDAAFTDLHLKSWGEDCLACHDGVDTYNKHFDHGKVPFTLQGAHEKADCYACHAAARSLVDLRGTPRDCLACHQKEEPHEGRFGTDCLKCHSMDAWKPASFDHNLAAFKLVGKHIEVACENCHKTGQTSTPTDCFGCHAKDDKHNGAFGKQCELCHQPTAWSEVTFDHNESFPLLGKHANVACESCHKDGKFAGTSTTCVGCHGYPGWHGAAFGANCADCHTVNGWSRASNVPHPWFSHPSEDGFGGMGNCRSCHPATVFQSTCVACHKNGVGGDGGGDD